MPTSNTILLIAHKTDCARRAARERARRAAAGATPRDVSNEAVLRAIGISSDAFYSRQRRDRLRQALASSSACDGVSCPGTNATEETASADRDGVACPDGDLVGKADSDGKTCRVVPGHGSDGSSCLISTADEDDGVSCTAPLIAATAPGNAPLDQATIRAQLVANAQASRDAFADLDPVFRMIRERGQ